MVCKDEMSKQTGEQLNKNSLVKFHAMLSKFLEKHNILPQTESEIDWKTKLERVLGSMAQLLNALRVSHANEEVKTAIETMTVEIARIDGITNLSRIYLQRLADSSKFIGEKLS
jgi:hypothetical protein